VYFEGTREEEKKRGEQPAVLIITGVLNGLRKSVDVQLSKASDGVPDARCHGE